MTNYEKLMQIMPKGTLAHLLVPGPLVRDSKGKVIGCKGLSII